MNADPTAAFSSEYVTNNLARKTIRSLGEDKARANASRYNEQLLLPVAKHLLTSGRVRRGEIGKMVKNLQRALHADSSVVSLESQSFSKKLSAKEEHRLAYVLATSDDSDWLDFVAAESRLQRSRIAMNMAVVDLRIHRHALSRYMQRELVPAERMLDSVGLTLHLSSLLAAAVVSEHDNNIAIPLADGLLLGKVYVTKDLGMRSIITMDKNGPVHKEETRHSITDKARTHVELLTYLDGASLGPVKEALRDKLLDFTLAYHRGAKLLFDASYYTCSPMPEGEAALHQMLADAIEGAVALVKTPEWKAFAANVGAAHG